MKEYKKKHNLSAIAVVAFVKPYTRPDEPHTEMNMNITSK